VARADRQPAPKLVYLEVVTTALRRLGLSEASITRSIFRGCGDGTLPYDHTGEAPPPGFWHTGPDNVRIDASDISNMLIDPASAEATVCKFTLPDVMLDWEAVGAKYPALRDTEPPELGASRIEVSFAAPLMRWLETLARWLWRKQPAPSTEEESKASATTSAPVSVPEKKLRRRDEALDWLLEKMEQNQPSYLKKMEWCRARLREGPAEFVEGGFPWTTAESIQSKLNDLIAGRLVRDPITGRVGPRKQ